MGAQQIKIHQGQTLEELEATVNDWMKKAHDAGIHVDYLGYLQLLGEKYVYLIDYHELDGDVDDEDDHV